MYLNNQQLAGYLRRTRSNPEQIEEYQRDSVVCPTVYEPVCGDDGKTYSNGCYMPSNVKQVHRGTCEEGLPSNTGGNTDISTGVEDQNSSSNLPFYIFGTLALAGIAFQIYHYRKTGALLENTIAVRNLK